MGRGVIFWAKPMMIPHNENTKGELLNIWIWSVKACQRSTVANAIPKHIPSRAARHLGQRLRCWCQKQRNTIQNNQTNLKILHSSWLLTFMMFCLAILEIVLKLADIAFSQAKICQDAIHHTNQWQTCRNSWAESLMSDLSDPSDFHKMAMVQILYWKSNVDLEKSRPLSIPQKVRCWLPDNQIPAWRLPRHWSMNSPAIGPQFVGFGSFSAQRFSLPVKGRHRWLDQFGPRLRLHKRQPSPTQRQLEET